MRRSLFGVVMWGGQWSFACLMGAESERLEFGVSFFKRSSLGGAAAGAEEVFEEQRRYTTRILYS